ncbi:MAG: hypothetical protein ICV66_10745 [Chitinophagaceae bacterium]|nr:hypothetical protein [Chitinophagaceae bacterium]
MQTKSATAILFSILLTPILFLLVPGCKKNNSINEEMPSISKATPFKEENAPTPANPHFNLEVILRGEDKGFGQVKFRQDNDAAKIVTLDVWVRDLEPNHQYLLQRAVDFILDGNCTGTSWLTLGKGLQPQAITTDEKGTGREELWRDLSALATGSTFDIHFQIVDAVTLAVVLTSDCYQYTVR